MPACAVVTDVNTLLTCAVPPPLCRVCPQVLFLVLAFNVMPNVVPSFINYIVSVVGPSVVAFMLS